MPPSHHNDALTSDDVRERDALDLANQELMQHLHVGEPVDEEWIERHYAHLAPELRQKLRRTVPMLKTWRKFLFDAAQRVEPAAAAVFDSVTGEIPAPLSEVSSDLAYLRSMLPDFEIKRCVHAGGQGIVYEAVQRSTPRTVAIKVLRGGVLASESARVRFTREAELVGKLRHPNIVTLYQRGTLQGCEYLVLEYVAGLPIDVYVKELDTRGIVRLMIEICSAVSYAHQRGVLHRDLKPANILVDGHGVSHILDFGLARSSFTGSSDAPATLTREYHVVGTIPYLSPERLAGPDLHGDARSDIYALGLILYQALAGRFPFTMASDPFKMRDSILEHEPMLLRKALALGEPHYRTRIPEVGDDLEVIVHKAMAPEPARRYQSAAALADDLKRFLAGEAIEARADNALYVLGRLVRKHRTAVAAGLTFAALLAAAAVVVTALWFHASAQRDNARALTRLMHTTFTSLKMQIDSAVQRLAGGYELSEQFIEQLARDLDMLAQLARRDPQMRDVLAATHEQLGDLALAAGRSDVARPHYQTFAELAAAEGRFTAALARAERKLAMTRADSAEGFERAIQIGEVLVQQSPASEQLQRELCETRLEFVRWLWPAGRFGVAANQLDHLLDVTATWMAREAHDSVWDELRANALYLDGDMRLRIGQGDRSPHSWSESIRLWRELSAARPADVQRRANLMRAIRRLATMYREQGDHDQAVLLLEEARAIGDYLLAADPQRADYQVEQFGTLEQLAATHRSSRRLNEALDVNDRLIAIAEWLRQASKSEPRWLRMYGLAHFDRAETRYHLEDWPGTIVDLHHALAALQSVAAVRPEDPRPKHEIALVLSRRGLCYGRLQEHERARHSLMEYFRIERSLCERDGAMADFCLNLCISHNQIAVWHLRRRSYVHDAAAKAHIEWGDAILRRIRQTAGMVGREHQVSSLEASIAENRALIEKRMQSHATRALQVK